MPDRLHPILAQLRARRIARGLTKRSLAKRLGYNRMTIERWESGKSVPSAIGLFDWCEALGLRRVPR